MKKNSKYEILLGLLLMCFFVVCSFYVILLGANAYSEMVDNNAKENTYRVAFDYIRNRLNEASSIDNIIVENNMIIIDEEEYDIVIYHDDYLKEMIVKDYLDTEILDGEDIIKIDNIVVEKKDNHVYVGIDERKMEFVKR